MKRSEINKIMKDAMSLLKEQKIILPPFVCFSPDEWKNMGKEFNEIKENELGWDITDFGSGDFDKTGLLLITLRNGNQKNVQKYPKPYAEKIMIVRENQVTPMHFHQSKMEDIINRGGGNLMIKLYNSDENGELSNSDVEISIDGKRCVFPAGHTIRLTPGESVTLTQGLYHRFGEKKERVML